MRSLKAFSLAHLPPLPQGIEVLLLVSSLQDVDKDVGDEATVHQTLALVLHQPTPAVRQAARALASTYIAAQTFLHQAPPDTDPSQWLADLLSRDEFGLVMVMVAAGEEHPPDELAVVIGLPSRLHQQLDMRLDCLIWVGTAPAPWSAESHAYIVGDQYSALQAVEVFSLLMAPLMVHCCDLWDLTEVVARGTSSRVVGAFWIAAEHRLVLPSEADARLLAQSTGVIVAQPLTSAFREVIEINKHARSLLSAEGARVVIDGQQLRISPHGASTRTIVPVLLIARLASYVDIRVP